MKPTKRKLKYDQASVNQDVLSKEAPDIGLIAMNSPNDPRPGIKIVDGQITEMDGKTKEEFDFIDQFIVKYGINIEEAEKAMALESPKCW